MRNVSERDRGNVSLGFRFGIRYDKGKIRIKNINFEMKRRICYNLQSFKKYAICLNYWYAICYFLYFSSSKREFYLHPKFYESTSKF